MKNKTNNKEMAELFLNMYTGCLKYKNEIEKNNSTKKINCDDYYKQFEYFTNKYFDEHKT